MAAELNGACSEAQRLAFSDPPQAVTIRVLPIADLPELVPFSNTRLLEDTRLGLAPRINFAPSRDQDGSEEHFVIIDATSVPAGAIVFDDDVPLIPSGGVYEVPISHVPGLSLQPPPESNEDFVLTLRSKTIDTKELPNCAGVLENVSDTAISPNVLFPSKFSFAVMILNTYVKAKRLQFKSRELLIHRYFLLLQAVTGRLTHLGQSQLYRHSTTRTRL